MYSAFLLQNYLWNVATASTITIVQIVDPTLKSRTTVSFMEVSVYVTSVMSTVDGNHQ